jgi:hypothetical protein
MIIFFEIWGKALNTIGCSILEATKTKTKTKTENKNKKE